MITANERDYTESAHAGRLGKWWKLALLGEEEEEERCWRVEWVHFKMERKASMRVSPPSTVGVPVTAIEPGDNEWTYGGQGSR